MGSSAVISFFTSLSAPEPEVDDRERKWMTVKGGLFIESLYPTQKNVEDVEANNVNKLHDAGEDSKHSMCCHPHGNMEVIN